MDTEQLLQLGLNKSEIKVYFALLDLDSSTVGPIIEKAKISDSKVYNILENLKQKGLVSYVIKNKVKHFQASDPENLITIIDEKQKKLEEQRNKLQNEIIPAIEEKRKLKSQKQEAVVYESINGVKAALDYLLKHLDSGEEYLVFTLGDELEDKTLINFFRNYHNKRIEKRVAVRLIYPEDIRDIVKEHHKYKNSKVRFTNKDIPIGTFVFRGHIMILVWGEKPTVFLIKSHQTYEHYRKLFESFWKQSKP